MELRKFLEYLDRASHLLTSTIWVFMVCQVIYYHLEKGEQPSMMTVLIVLLLPILEILKNQKSNN